MLVMNKNSDCDWIKQVPYPSRLGPLLAQRISARIAALQRDTNPAGRSLALFGSGRVLDIINSSDADVVHLHWICGEMLNIRQITQIRKPAVWTMHDNWTFCGAEHYMNPLCEDNRSKSGYTAENRSPLAKGIDIDAFTYRRKLKANWHDLPFLFSAPSQWLADAFTRSFLFHDIPCEVIPNALNTDIFQTGNRQAARKKFAVPEGKFTLLFGAQDANSPLKGGSILMESLNLLAGKVSPDKIHVLLFGKNTKVLTKNCSFPFTDLQIIEGDHDMASLYSAADVFILPSLADNMPYTAVEALACGTPVVAFRIGGLPEIVEHKVNGFLAEPFKPDSLTEGILYVMNNRMQLSAAARKNIHPQFSEVSVAEQYTALYRKVLEKC